MIKKREVLRRTPGVFQKQLNIRWYIYWKKEDFRREIDMKGNKGFNVEFIRFEIPAKI